MFWWKYERVVFPDISLGYKSTVTGLDWFAAGNRGPSCGLPVSSGFTPLSSHFQNDFLHSSRHSFLDHHHHHHSPAFFVFKRAKTLLSDLKAFRSSGWEGSYLRRSRCPPRWRRCPAVSGTRPSRRPIAELRERETTRGWTLVRAEQPMKIKPDFLRPIRAERLKLPGAQNKPVRL